MYYANFDYSKELNRKVNLSTALSNSHDIENIINIEKSMFLSEYVRNSKILQYAISRFLVLFFGKSKCSFIRIFSSILLMTTFSYLKSYPKFSNFNLDLENQKSNSNNWKYS